MKTEFTDTLFDYITHRMDEDACDSTKPEYASMKYPKLIPFMRFTTKRYHLDGFGSIMVMSTNAMGGLMKLLTVSFTPNEGLNVPFLLVDCMSMKKKKLAYVEYYDCTGKKLCFDELSSLAEKYTNVPDYAEKEAWYVKERMPASMIKGGEGVDSSTLLELAERSIDAYLELVGKAEKDEQNLKGLKAFQERMVTEGNPSSETMNKVLGEEGQVKFFRDYVMPLIP
ncbi:MAG: hypothetical protein MJ153_08620 [Clostridia bacterium]|nr:hypothetical protein [Clostridia bacterium]